MKKRTNGLLLAVMIISILVTVSNRKISSNNYDGLIFKYASKYGLDPYLVKGLIKTESDFNPNAVSNVGAIGLAQIMPETGRLLGYSKRELYNPEKNIEASCKFLAFLKKKASKYGWDEEYTRKKMLQGYYAGPGYIGKSGIDLYHMVYVNKVLRNYYGFKGSGQFSQSNYVKIKRKIKTKPLRRVIIKRLNKESNTKFINTDYYVKNTHTKLKSNDFEYFQKMRNEYNQMVKENLKEYNQVKNQAKEEFKKIQEQMNGSMQQNIKKNENIINVKIEKEGNEINIIFKSEEDKQKFLSLSLKEKLKLLGK